MSSAAAAAGVDLFRKLLERAGLRVQANGAGFKAQCPCHQDEIPSMDFRVGDRAPVVAKCHAGSCGADLLTMLEELGASDADRSLILGGTPKCGQSPAQREYVHHVYEDADGNPIARKVRGVCGGMTARRSDGSKDMGWEYFNAGTGRWLTRAAWDKAHPGVQPPKPALYHLPGVRDAIRDGRPVYVAEGEKAADALERIGCSPATTNPHGAGKWTAEHSAQLVGVSAAIIFEDDDAAGRDHVETVALPTQAAGVPDVRVIRFERQRTPDGQTGGGDVADWILERERAGATLERICAELQQRIDAAPPWTPAAAPDAPGADQAPASPLACMVSLRQAAARPQIEQPSVFKNGGLPFGYYGVGHGPGGIGKTREKLRMIVLRLLGRSWHCWEPSGEPFRPLVLSLEIDTNAIAAIVKDITDSIGPGTWAEIENKVGMLGAPDFVEPFKAGISATTDLFEMIDGASKRLELDWAPKPANYVLLDSFGEVKEDPSDKPEAYAPGIAMLRHVARARHACLDVIHHNRRLPAGASKSSSPSDDFRGPATFLNSSRFACAFDEHLNRRRITWHRVSFGARPADSYFDLNEHGVPVEEAAPPMPRAVGDANRQTVLDTLLALSRASDFAGAAKGAIHGAMPVNPKTKKPFSDDTVLRHLTALETDQLVRRSGQGRGVVYFPADGITASPHDHRNNGCGDG